MAKIILWNPIFYFNQKLFIKINFNYALVFFMFTKFKVIFLKKYSQSYCNYYNLLGNYSIFIWS
jgi:hypothetical protein